MSNRRSAASLLAAGAATITLDHRLDVPRLRTTLGALQADLDALSGDGRRVKGDLTDTLRHR